MAHILVLDNESMIRHPVNCMLTDAGHTVVEAGNWAEGETMCRRGSFDLMIVDLMPTENDGRDFVQNLHRNYPDLVVIALSGALEPPAGRGIARFLNVSTTLLKPFGTADLLKAVNEALEAAPQKN